MILESLRKTVLDANLSLKRHGLVFHTFGNASGISREEGLVVIKPSGVRYESLHAGDLVVTDLEGNVVDGALRPSSDLPTHLVLYRAFPELGGVAHTHSRYAAAWAQAGREIPCLGTTHADYFHGPIPITEPMRSAEIESEYEASMGRVLVRRVADMDRLSVPAVLAHGHGPFCWGSSPIEAAHLARVVEEIARTAYYTVTINPSAEQISKPLLDKHFLRKHGPGAYYGQR